MNEKKSNIIWNKYQNNWQELYQEYMYAFKDYQEYTIFVKNYLNQSNVNDNKEIDYYYDIIKKSINNYIAYHLHKKKAKNLLLRYIDCKLEKNNVAYKEINKFIKWLKAYDYEPTPNTIINLIENNETFKDLIKKLVECNLDKIKQYGIEKVFNNELIALFVEIYCSLNDIELEIDENDLESDSNNLEEEQNHLTKDYMPTGADAFLFEIRNKDLKVLTKEEERELLTKIKQGDKDAYQCFYEHNLRLVISIAKKYRNYRVDYEDLLQEGYIGLMTAINRFELERNFKFSTYATWWIRQSVTRAISKYGRSIGIAINRNESLSTYQKKVDNYADELGRKPTDEEIAKHFDMSLKEVQENNQLLLPNISMNYRINDVDDSEFGDFISDDSIQIEDDFITSNLSSELQTLFKNAGLLPIEIAILSNSWGLNNQIPMSLADLGKKYGFSRERARQYEARAIIKLREFSGTKDFALYLDNPDMAKTNLQKLRNWHYNHSNSKIVFDIDLSKIDLEIEKKVVKERPLNKPKKENYLYSIFPKYQKEDIDAVVATLSTYEKKILTIYGEYLTNPTIYSSWNKQDVKIAYQNIIDKINYCLNRPNVKNARISSIYDLTFIKKYTKEEIKVAVFMLDSKDQEIIYLRYGSNLDNPIISEKWSFKKYGDIFYKVVIPHIIENLKLIQKQNKAIDEKIINLNSNNNIDSNLKCVYIKALKLTRILEFKKISQFFSPKEAEILAILCIKYLENIDIEINDFVYFLDIDKKEFNEYLKTVLEFFKQNEELIIELKNKLYMPSETKANKKK